MVWCAFSRLTVDRTRPYSGNVIFTEVVLGAYFDVDETGRESEECRGIDAELAGGIVVGFEAAVEC